MLLIDEIKIQVRVSKTNIGFDEGEIEPLMDAARHELILSGVSSQKVQNDKQAFELDGDKLDPLIKRAITVYVKANFGWDNPDSEKLNSSFQSLKAHLSLSGDYNAIS
ncbi:DNA-packaging protein [Neobacillus niacini]|uniref:phage head-tail connector protein n=1 Tax=Neobacillus niacini TaxID=86668 RepID=UPI002FFEF0B8